MTLFIKVECGIKSILQAIELPLCLITLCVVATLNVGKLMFGGYIALISIVSYFVSSLLETTKGVIHFFRLSLTVILLLFLWSTGDLYFIYSNLTSDVKEKSIKTPPLVVAIQDLLELRTADDGSGEIQVENIYVTQLSFIDAKTRSLIQPSDSELINNAVVDGIQQALKTDPNLKFNEPGHIIKNTSGNVNKLIDLVFDPMLTPAERTMKIISEMMNPANVDVIVTGQFTDERETISIKPITIIKRNEKVVAKSLLLLKPDYLCDNPVYNRKKELCTNTHEKIAQAVKELLEQYLLDIKTSDNGNWIQVLDIKPFDAGNSENLFR